MSLVQDEMLSRLSRMFGEPRTSDVEGFLEEFERSLKGFSRDVLKRATDAIIDNSDRPFWPTVGECRAACRKAADDLAGMARMASKPEPIPDLPPPTPEEAARIWALVQEAKRTMESVKEPERDLPDVTREAFERFRRSVVNTTDGMARHRASVLRGKR